MTCTYCQEKLPSARGLCMTCYRYHARNGTLDQFAKVDPHRKGGRPKDIGFTGVFPKVRLRLTREDVFGSKTL